MSVLNDPEQLSLQASAVVADLACEEMAKVPGLTFSQACQRVMQREPHLRAAYAGDGAQFVGLTQRGRTTQMATPVGGQRTRRFRRAGPPRAIRRRPIRDRSELLDGEVLCVHMHAAPGTPTLFAETLA